MILQPSYSTSFFESAARYLYTLCFALAISACAQDSDTGSHNTAPETNNATPLSLTQWLDEQYEQELQFSPIELTFLGRKERNDELDAFTYLSLIHI